MIKIYFSFLFCFFVHAGLMHGQNCNGKHSLTMLPLASQSGVDFAYRINHCTNGDEILLQITNTNAGSVNLVFTPKVSSPNQNWTSPASYTMTIAGQSTLNAPNTCGNTNSALELIGTELFPNEYFPQNNTFPQILSIELLNISVNP